MQDFSLTPTVTLVIPCYKQAQFLPDAIKSVILQTYSNWECIIVDDGSPDQTREVAAKLIAENPEYNIQLFSKPNGGLSDARNFGFSRARGRFFMPLDADDALTANALEKFVAALETHPQASIAFSHYYTFGTISEFRACGPLELPCEAYENRIMYASLYRREVYEAIGGYDPGFTAYEDWDFWIGALERGIKGILVDPREPYLLYRVKEQSMFSEAKLRHQELFSKIVLKHPGCYNREEIEAARALIELIHSRKRPERPPLISVVIPCYNHAKLLTEAVESLVNQTFSDWECIIVDDGSPDDTADVAKALIAKYKEHQIELVRKANGGLADARNTGITKARGKYILPLDADDKLHPTMLEKGIRPLEADPTIGIVFSDTQHFGGRNDVYQNGPFELAALAENNTLPASVLHRRAIFSEIGGFDSSLSAYEDWDYWLRAVQKGWRAVHIPEPLFQYRKEAESMLSEADKKRAWYVSNMILRQPHLYDEITIERAKIIVNAIRTKNVVPPPGDYRKVLIFSPDDDGPASRAIATDIVKHMQTVQVPLCTISATGAVPLVDRSLMLSGLDPNAAAQNLVTFLRREQPTRCLIIGSELGYLLAPILHLNAVECRVGELAAAELSAYRHPGLLSASGTYLDFSQPYTLENNPGSHGALHLALDNSLRSTPRARGIGINHYLETFNQEWLQPGTVEALTRWRELLGSYTVLSCARPPEGKLFKHELFLLGHTFAPEYYGKGEANIRLS